MDTYIQNFKEIFGVFGIPVDFLDNEISANKERRESISNSLSKILFPELVQEILSHLGDDYFEFFKTREKFTRGRGEGKFKYPLKGDSMEIVEYPHARFTYYGDFLLGVYSKGNPMIFLNGFSVNLLETSIEDERGNFYLLPIPLPTSVLCFTDASSENISSYIFLFHNSEKKVFTGFLNELLKDPGVVFYVKDGISFIQNLNTDPSAPLGDSRLECMRSEWRKASSTDKN